MTTLIHRTLPWPKVVRRFRPDRHSYSRHCGILKYPCVTSSGSPLCRSRPWQWWLFCWLCVLSGQRNRPQTPMVSRKSIPSLKSLTRRVQHILIQSVTNSFPCGTHLHRMGLRGLSSYLPRRFTTQLLYLEVGFPTLDRLWSTELATGQRSDQGISLQESLLQCVRQAQIRTGS